MKDVLKHGVMWHGAAMLPRLRKMEVSELRQLAQELDVTGETPLQHFHELSHSEKQKLIFPTWSTEPQTGAQAVALMVFTVWVMCGEQEELCSALCESWPVREVVCLCS